jgi:hypothetical protein
MKTNNGFIRALICLVIPVVVAPLLGFAQDQPIARQFGQEELDQMLAPIALYPDSLLAQILMAATYPLEVVQADRWTKANRNLGGDQLNDALDQKDWDPSVKALMPFPQVLSMMSERLEWTEKVGDAFLDQQDQVMDTVQRLRARAQAAGNLADTEEERVIVQEGSIEIEPANPEVVYVPVYDPTVIYGPWWYPAFPPFFFLPPPGVVIGFHGRIGFGRGVTVGRAWGHAWGNWDWHHHHMNVNINRHININRNINITQSNIQTTPWQHDVSHRKGVTYRSEATRERFGQVAKGADKRRDFRGFGQETKYQPPAITTRQDVPKTKGGEAPVTASKRLEQPRGAGGLGQKGPNLSKNKSAFGGVGRGSDARTESNRGFQSRQSMSSKERSGVQKGNVGRPR